MWTLNLFLKLFLSFTSQYLIIIDTTIYSAFTIGQPLFNAVYVGQLFLTSQEPCELGALIISIL